MKRQIKYITAPITIWTHPDLSVFERVVLIEIDSYCASNIGTQASAQVIASSIGLPTKTVRETLKSLKDKRAISVNIGENGEKYIKPFLYKDRYVANPNEVEIGDKPTDAIIGQIDYDEIAKKWNEHLPMMPQISRWTPLRKKKLKGVLKQAGLAVDDLVKCFRIISVTPFLCGENDRKWQATFNWLIGSSSNLLKVFEGTYSKTFSEKRDYEEIMNGKSLTNNDKDDYYR